ncbi:MAG: ribosome recycling factor [Christensenellaceae bacterium]|jgi:ribosome recycling factor|nr:ribosome recycling factor [Christensenellaceae bacterium]
MEYDIEEVALIFEDAEERFGKTVHSLNHELNSLKAGRANVSILDRVLVSYYGVPTKLNQMANIMVPEARVIQINVWDATQIKAVEKAITDANIGLTPNNDGKCIRLIFPELTKERRVSLVKEIKTIGENAKIASRNVRRDAVDEIKKLKKDLNLSEDAVKIYEGDIDKLASGCIGRIEKALADKEKEIMSV